MYLNIIVNDANLNDVQALNMKSHVPAVNRVYQSPSHCNHQREAQDNLNAQQLSLYTGIHKLPEIHTNAPENGNVYRTYRKKKKKKVLSATCRLSLPTWNSSQFYTNLEFEF